MPRAASNLQILVLVPKMQKEKQKNGVLSALAIEKENEIGNGEK